jgi:hypothetical protein
VGPSNTPFAQRAWEAYAALVPVIFIPAVWLWIGYSELSQERAHNNFLAQLRGLSTALVLELDGSKVDDASRIIADLKRVNLFRGEHAPGPNPKWYRIEIRDDQRTLRLLLARPDDALDKYWVYLPGNDFESFSRSIRVPSLGVRIGGFIDPQLAAFLGEYERQ